MGDDSNEVRINVRTTENRRSQWKEYADENEDVDSMSHLIHRAVSEYTSRGGDVSVHGGGDDDSIASEAVIHRLDTLVSAVESLNDRFTEFDDRLSHIADGVNVTVDVEAADVIKALPPAEPYTSGWRAVQGVLDPDDDDPLSPVAWEGTVEALVEYFSDFPDEVSESRIQEVLAQAVDTDIVESAVVDGQTRYYSPEKSAVADVRGDLPREVRRDKSQRWD